MAKNNRTETWRKYVLSVLSLTVATTLSLGVFTACSDGSEDSDDEDTTVSATDTQLIRNGNFEFYSDKDVEKLIEKHGVVNTPNNWTFSAGTPTSDTASGIIDSADWSYFTRTGGYPFSTYTKDDEEVTTFASIEEAAAHWEDDNVSAYDRLKFLDVYEDEIDDLDDDSEEAELFAEYSYSVDFEDVEHLMTDIGADLTLHDDAAQRENGDTSVLMIHNRRTSENVLGTAQRYTSGTTVTLAAGTAAKLSVWVRTDALTHYYSEAEETEVTQRGGAYIGITNTVGGTTLDQMQIKNINTKGEWKQYTVYVRASTFASTTFTVVLGLGQGSSSDRYENVNGYAFFDDVACEVITAADYEAAVSSDWNTCTVDSLAKEKIFDTDKVEGDTFALDLYAGFDAAASLLDEVDVALTSEVSGSKTYTSESIHPSLGDSEENVTGLMTLSEIAASSNRYLQNVYKNDLDENYPFGEDGDILMLLSANGAAYTAKTGDITLAAGERMLVSFFAKTSEIANGLTGANAILVDGENRTSLTAFDSNTVDTVDIDDETKDIYDGWVQCFFFLANDTDEDKTCHIEFTYGPTSIVSTDRYDYADGYAAFTNFETKMLTRTEYSYASTGDRAVKVSLTGKAASTSAFDEVSATARKDIEERPALPASFQGTLGGSTAVVPDSEISNVKPENVYAGLLDAEYADNYYASEEAWRNILDTSAANGDEWWTGLFGNANRPLVIANGEEASYGFISDDISLSASSAQRVSMRVRLSENAKAYILLTDKTNSKTAGNAMTTNAPAVTYWYDDNGNICRIDPSSDEYDRHSDVLFTLNDNGLYTRTGDTSAMYYANLYNYEKDDEGNLVTRDGTVAFYENEGRYYAYYDLETDSYSTEVSCLPTEVGGETITRYDFRNETLPTAVIEVDGAKAKGEWVTVSFYLNAGSEAKTYRLEVWSGSRDGSEPNPAGSYVIFDNYTNASTSDFATLRDEALQEVKEANGVAEDDNITDPAIALYYTFTFYDATSYLRYDATQDEDELGNPYGSYTQSSYEEQLIYLYWDDSEGMATGSPAYTFFLDYSAADVTVEEDDLGESDDTTDGEDDSTADSNVWLLISSGVLAVVLVAVIVLVIVRRQLEKRSRKQRVKAASAPVVRPVPPQVRKSSAKKDEPAVPEDENDPYNN